MVLMLQDLLAQACHGAGALLFQQSNVATFQMCLEVMMFLDLSFLQTACLYPTFSRALPSECTLWAMALSWLRI